MENLANTQNPANGLVSVIIPCYNQAHYLPTALNSVLEQTYPHLEIIVVNDGSPDNIGEVMAAYAEDERVRLINQENRGLSGARNAAIEVAQGQYLQFLDADDWLHPNKIARQVEILDASGPEVALVYCNFWSVHNDTELDERDSVERRCLGAFEPDIFNTLWLQNIFPPHAVLLRREWQQRLGFFNPAFPPVDDYEYWLRLSGMGGQVRYLPERLAYYRQHAASMSRNKEAMDATAIEVRSEIARLFPAKVGPATDFAIRRLTGMADEVRAWSDHLQEDVYRLEQAATTLEKQGEELQAELRSVIEQKTSADEYAVRLEGAIRDKDAYIKKLEEDKELQWTYNHQLEEEKAERDKLITELKLWLDELEASLETKNKYIGELEGSLPAKNEHIWRLETRLAAMQNSRVYRATQLAESMLERVKK